MIEHGKLRQRITFQLKSVTSGSMGQPSSTWNDVLTVWARVVSARGQELFNGQQYNPEVTHQVTVLSSPDIDAITPLHRISFESKFLDILSVNFGERRMDPVIITCKERVLSTGTAQ